MNRRGMPCEGKLSSDFCMNGGTCYYFKHRNKIDYHCVCEKQFSGDRCETDKTLTDEILSSKVPCQEPFRSDFCQNQGVCYALIFSNSFEYHCECPDGYKGYQCEEKTLDGFYGTGLKSHH